MTIGKEITRYQHDHTLKAKTCMGKGQNESECELLQKQ